MPRLVEVHGSFHGLYCQHRLPLVQRHLQRLGQLSSGGGIPPTGTLCMTPGLSRSTYGVGAQRVDAAQPVASASTVPFNAYKLLALRMLHKPVLWSFITQRLHQRSGGGRSSSNRRINSRRLAGSVTNVPVHDEKVFVQTRCPATAPAPARPAWLQAGVRSAHRLRSRAAPPARTARPRPSQPRSGPRRSALSCRPCAAPPQHIGDGKCRFLPHDVVRPKLRPR